MAPGEVLEWPIRHAWKACRGASPSWVRIPPSPPVDFGFSFVSWMESDGASRLRGEIRSPRTHEVAERIHCTDYLPAILGTYAARSPRFEPNGFSRRGSVHQAVLEEEPEFVNTDVTSSGREGKCLPFIAADRGQQPVSEEGDLGGDNGKSLVAIGKRMAVDERIEHCSGSSGPRLIVRLPKDGKRCIEPVSTLIAENSKSRRGRRTVTE